MSKCKVCFLFFFFLAASIAFFSGLSVSLLIYLYSTSIRDGEAEQIMAPGNATDDSFVISYPINRVLDDNIAIYIWLAGVTMFLIGIIVFVCRKVKIMIVIPHVRAISNREQYLEKIMGKKAIIAELARMHAQYPIPPLPEGVHHI